MSREKSRRGRPQDISPTHSRPRVLNTCSFTKSPYAPKVLRFFCNISTHQGFFFPQHSKKKNSTPKAFEQSFNYSGVCGVAFDRKHFPSSTKNDRGRRNESKTMHRKNAKNHLEHRKEKKEERTCHPHKIKEESEEEERRAS
ncbi:hypothetical protein CDAR_580441 [Caerostris darwini]|uniref:Uncharacterized protein n=1 Tax=Caerostris darwini TaxID=1538125 RepID=A0AAV4REP0_9ARAC|nr:hypothetical protein CDAR_580441 [Caerostris darwini]